METSKNIENKIYPLNEDIDKLNYYFSAYLNSIQSLKDACQTATSAKFSWSEISPTYGSFIYYCRNATTHDGSHMINAGQGEKNYIIGPLRRIDNRGNVIEFSPPNEDVSTLSVNISKEIFKTIKNFIKDKGQNIPVPDEKNFNSGVDLALQSEFIPDEIKKMITSNEEKIKSSINGATINIAQEILSFIASVETKL